MGRAIVVNRASRLTPDNVIAIESLRVKVIARNMAGRFRKALVDPGSAAGKPPLLWRARQPLKNVRHGVSVPDMSAAFFTARLTAM